MTPPTTLPDPRHEAFAFALARGLSPRLAYVEAGYSSSNARLRSQELAADPAILARVEHLKACLPHIEAMKARFAPSLLLMPETPDELLAWLWQIMSGTRQIMP